jgi:hypothetical protein
MQQKAAFLPTFCGRYICFAVFAPMTGPPNLFTCRRKTGTGGWWSDCGSIGATFVWSRSRKGKGGIRPGAIGQREMPSWFWKSAPKSLRSQTVERKVLASQSSAERDFGGNEQLGERDFTSWQSPKKEVAILSPIAWRTPPRQYGAWETVASNITEGLVARGWDVTLLASRDSKDGQTGFLVDNVTEAVRSLGRISEIDRRACRSRVRQYFSIDTHGGGIRTGLLDDFRSGSEKMTMKTGSCHCLRMCASLGTDLRVVIDNSTQELKSSAGTSWVPATPDCCWNYLPPICRLRGDPEHCFARENHRINANP